MLYSTILVVDDEPINLDLMRKVLGAEYRLLCATGGEEAVHLARAQLPSLILLDIEMSGMDGYSVCKALKAEPATANIPIIFVSSHSKADEESKGFACGGVDYIIKPINPEILRVRVKTHLSLVHSDRLEESYKEAIFMLGSAGHYNDTDTGVHIWRMAAFAKELAVAAGWSKANAHLLEMAAPMHDTGKIGIPGSILRKPGKLDAAEWVVMRTHSAIGHSILGKSESAVFQLAAEIALRHHEKWDGNGYPDGLVGEAIPESARIVAIADVFDALTMKRPYKEAWSIDKVVATLVESSGSHFEPRLLDLFISILPRILAIKVEWDASTSKDAEVNVTVETKRLWEDEQLSAAK
jgi:putative two-component system response regulator